MNRGAEKTVVIIARRDPVEAMRVAAGITVFGHHVSLVFAHGLLESSPEIMEGAELIELADVAPFSLFDDPEIPDLSAHLFAGLLEKSDAVINV